MNSKTTVLLNAVSLTSTELSELKLSIVGKIFHYGKDLIYVLCGAVFVQVSTSFVNYFMLLLLVLSTGWCAFELVAESRNENSRTSYQKILFVLTLLTLSSLGLLLAPAKIEPRHMLYVAPFVVMLVSHAVERCAYPRGDVRLGGQIIYLATLLSVVSFVNQDWNYLRALQSSGGKTIHGAGLEQVSEYLLSRSPAKVVMLDWGLNDSLVFYSSGQIPILSNFEAKESLDELITENNVLFLSFYPFTTRYNLYTELASRLGNSNRRLSTLREIPISNSTVVRISQVAQQTNRHTR